MTTAVRIRAGGATDPGLARENNEDRFHIDAENGIFFVVDGVGGHAAGEVASDIAYTVLRSRLERRTGVPEERVREAIALANREIHQKAQAHPEWTGMACVLTVALVENGSVTVGHVGDTRLYELRGERIRQVTHDHSPVGAMEEEGRLTEAEAMRHPRRNEIYRDVGSVSRDPDDQDFIEIHRFPFEPEAALLLCTDGLTDQVPARPILRIAQASPHDPETAARRLVLAANEAGGKDNVTTVLVFGDRFPGQAPKIRGWSQEPAPERLEGGPGFAGRAARTLGGRLPLVTGVLLLGIVLTTLLFYAPSPDPPGTAPYAARTLLVGLPDSPFPSLGAALAAARPGDTIEVGPGTYREEIALKDGVTLVSRPRRGAVLEPAEEGSPEPRVAVTAVSVHGARMAGFVIRGRQARPLIAGVHIRDSTVELDDLDISGAERTAVEISGSGGPVLRASDIHDNSGTGLVVRDEARPLVAHNVLLRNGRKLGRPGVEITGAARPILVGNVIADNGAEGVWMPGPEDPAIREHNVFVTGRGSPLRDPIRLVPPDQAMGADRDGTAGRHAPAGRRRVP